jgi:hypothetical protein
MQLELSFETADKGAQASSNGARAGHRSPAQARVLPKSKLKSEKAATATMEAVIDAQSSRD